MRTLLGFLILCSPLVTRALDTSQCPNTLNLSYAHLIPASEKRIERLRRHANPDVYRLALKARQTIIRTGPEMLQNLAFKFDQGAAGICKYRRSSEGQGRIEIYSRRGVDYLRVLFPFSGLEVFTVHPLERVTERGIKIDYRPTTVVQVKVGSQSYQVGWAYSLSVEP